MFCHLRVSGPRVSFPIVKRRGYATVSGDDKRLYLFRVNDMMGYLERVFGKADKTVKTPRQSDFAGLKGILS